MTISFTMYCHGLAIFAALAVWHVQVTYGKPSTTASAVIAIPRPTCTVVHTPNADDTASINAAIQNCSSNATILFQSGVEYNTYVSFLSPYDWD